MKVKVLKIRISDQFQNMDEAVLNDYLERYEIIDLHTQLILSDVNYWSVFINYEEKERKVILNKTNAGFEEELTEEEMIIYNKLKHWRAEKARESQLPPYIIFHNAHLMSIARHKPSNFEDLENVSGLGKVKIEKYGAEIIEVLESA
ncbi:HRDC domain-containing protein [Epilithonimonas sp. UC225_85]|uniref:HRDC domain-containing protein n=1 Tax=Epilithonimonas sp. UC225_85 TaxID=3350167 RepID=UPI0036D421D3